MRLHVVSEVRRVVPDVKSRTNPRPTLDVPGKRCVGGMIQRLAEIALDRAKPHDDIRTWPQCLRGTARVLISQRINSDVGEFRANLFRDVVDEVQHRAGMTALPIIDRPALRTFARPLPIVLRNRDDAGSRSVQESLTHTS